jgi:hypothetical protein
LLPNHFIHSFGAHALLRWDCCGAVTEAAQRLAFLSHASAGVVFEEIVQLAYLHVMSKATEAEKEQEGNQFSIIRLFGYVWVVAFMTWSGPAWLYPQASSPPLPGQKTNFFPHSVITAWKMGDVRAG